MENVPWRAEVELAAEQAGEILKRQFPDLNIHDVTFLNEGWDSFAFLADGKWVFLFPKRRDRESLLLASVRLLDELHDLVPLPIPHPRHRGRPDDGFPFHFAGYRFLPGAPGDLVDMPARCRSSNARRLGEFLSALHHFPVERARELGIMPHRRDHAEFLLEEARRLADRLATRIPEDMADACKPFLDGTVERPPSYVGPLCLTHGDLQAEHILLDESGAICGVIDFGDATIGEPTGDFVGLCAWQGWDFAQEALRAAGASADEKAKKRILFMARCLALINLGWADWQDQARASVYRRFLHNSFRD